MWVEWSTKLRLWGRESSDLTTTLEDLSASEIIKSQTKRDCSKVSEAGGLTSQDV